MKSGIFPEPAQSVAAVDEETADRGAVTADEFRRRARDDVRPALKGRSKYGVASVSSTIKGTFASRATSATASTSSTSTFGLLIVSAKSALVFSRISFSKFLGLGGVDQRDLDAQLGKGAHKALYVPP